MYTYMYTYMWDGGLPVAGLFFIIPCMDNYIKVDLRTVSFDVPPQEVSYWLATAHGL